MRSLSEIWNSEVPTDSINNLDTLIIEECDKLVNVFTCYTMEIFQSLCSLTVKNCKSMKAIFDLADGKRYAKCKTKLQDVHLETLPELEQVLKWKRGQDSVVNWNNIRKIWLQDCERVENIFPSSVDKTFKNLEYLVAWGCSRLREIVAKGEEANSNNSNSAVEFKFPELTTIKFLELPNFKSFYLGECKLNCPKLKDLSIERCDKLEPFREEITNNQGRCILFPVEVINNLKSMQIESGYAKSSTGYNYRRDKLEELRLSRLRNIEILYSFLYHNPKLKSLWLNDCSFGVLVPLKRPVEIDSLGFVPKLKSLNLTNLAWLKEIGFERDTIFQRIESLILKNCPRLDTITPSSVFFSHLTNLEVVECHRLKYLVSLRTAKSLVQLSTMKVNNCDSLKEIVSEQGSEEEEEEGREKEENASKFNTTFKQLKALELVSLKSLESFCRSKSCAFEFPSLEKFVVNACSKLENFTEKVKGSIVLQKVYTAHEKENRWCWEDNLQATIQYIFQKKKYFEGMDELNVSDHPELEEVWQCKEGPPKDWFYSLKTLKLKDCKFDKYAIPSNVLGRLKSLQELEVRDCSDITFIFEMNGIKIRETLLRLKKLTLKWLPAVTHVWQQEQEEHKQGILSFKNLQQVSVTFCGELKALLPEALARDLKMLEKLEVKYCYNLPQIVGNEGEAADGTVVFPRLTSLVLKWLPSLTCLFPERFVVGCPKLHYLCVCHSDQLDPKKFSKEGPPKDWFYSLKTLKLKDCKFEKYAIPSNVLGRLKSLQELEVRDCRNITFIFEMNDIKIRETPLRLKKLTLKGLWDVTHVWQQEQKEHKQGILSFKNLQQVSVKVCYYLQTLLPAALARDLKMLEKLEVDSCNKLPQIVGKEEEAADGTENVFVFPRLTSLVLYSLPKLTCFYSESSLPKAHLIAVECPELEYLDVRSCPKLELFQSQQESDRKDQGCSFFSDIKEISKVEKLYLSWKDAKVWLGQSKDQYLQYLSELDLHLGDYEQENFTLPSPILEKAPNLEKMQIGYCTSLKEITAEGMLGHLKRLELWHLQGLQSIQVLEYLPKLQELRVSYCRLLITLVQPSAAKMLTDLEEMYVASCESMKEIVGKGQDETAVQEIKFERLETISLVRLSSLECFHSGNATLQLPSLSQVNILECPKMKSFSQGLRHVEPPSRLIQVSYDPWDETEFVLHHDLNFVARCVPVIELKDLVLGDYPALKGIWLGEVQMYCLFRNLKSLVVEGCEFLSNAILPSHLLPFLSNLKMLEVRKCDSVMTIFDVKNTATNNSDMSVIPLEKLTLKQLPTLRHVWNEDPKGRLSLPYLEEVIVSECESIKILFPASVPKDYLQKLDVRNCAGLVGIVAKEETAATEEANHKLDVFPNVTSLTLWHLPKLRCICLGMSILHWPELENLNVYDCPMLTIFAADSLSSPDSYPEVGEDHFTSEKHGIVSARKPIKLELRSLYKLESIGFEHTWVASLVENLQHLEVLACTSLTNLAPCTVSFSRLTELNVEDCAGLKYLFTSSTARSLVVLSKMSIINCESLETVVAVADDAEGDNPYEDVVFPELCSLSLKKLSKLGSFYMGNSTLKFPSLFCVEITQCKSMKTFSLGNVEVPELYELEINGAGCTSLTNLAPSTVSFSDLTELNVEDCAGLEYLFTSSTARRLVVLRKMSITNCESLETVVVADDEEGEKKDEDAVFPDPRKLDVRNCAELEEIDAKDDETATEEASKKVAVFPEVTSLTLWNLPKLRCICSGMDILDWPVLRDLDVYHCQMLKIFATGFQNSLDLYPEGQDHFTTNKHGIISADKVPPNLERLSLNKEDFILIEQGLLPHVNLQLREIKFLRLQGFNDDSNALLPELFLSKVSAPCIQEFGVADSAFKEIFPSQMPGMDFTTKILSQLKKLELRSLYKLESIGFEHTWVAPLVQNLQHLKVLACTCLTNLAPSTVSFSCLTELNVEDCAGLKYLFTFSTARSLVVLSDMSIINCESLDTIVVADDEEEDKKDEDVVFPYLFSLSLKNLPKLGSFNIVTNLAPSTVSFSCLNELNVEDCAGLKYLFTSSTAKRLVELEKMSITNCESLETVVVAEKGDNPDEDVEFPELSSLSLRNLPKLGSFYAGNSTLKFPNLGFSVEITQCKSMKTFSHGDVEVHRMNKLEIDDPNIAQSVNCLRKLGSSPEFRHNVNSHPPHDLYAPWDSKCNKKMSGSHHGNNFSQIKAFTFLL